MAPEPGTVPVGEGGRQEKPSVGHEVDVVEGLVGRSRLQGRRSWQPRRSSIGTAELLTKQYFTKDQARAIATELGIDFRALGCDLEQFRLGLGVELEHGPRSPESDVSWDDPLVTGRIALAHLTEFPDYYTRLAVLEREAADHLRSAG